MDISPRYVAGEVLRVIPLVTRKVAADLRKSERSTKLAHIGLLRIVAKKPCSLSKLSEFHAVSLPTMSKTITTIEKLGWVVRVRSESDRRVVMVEATPAGKAALKEVYDLAIAPIASALDSLTEAQRRQLSQGLAALRDAFADVPTELEEEGP